MSRSTKKPWRKDSSKGRLISPRKKLANRRYRTFVKQQLKPWKLKYWWHTGEQYCGFCECSEQGEPWEVGACYFMLQDPEPYFPPPHRFTDPWEICDWRYYSDDPRCSRK